MKKICPMCGRAFDSKEECDRHLHRDHMAVFQATTAQSGTATQRTRTPSKRTVRVNPDLHKNNLQSIRVNDDGSVIEQYQDDIGWSHVGCTCNAFLRKQPGMLATCAHLHEAITCEWDVAAEDGIKVSLPSKVVVPLFNKPGTEAYVYRDEFSSASIREVFLNWDPQTGHRLSGQASIGFVTQFTGRRSLRDLVLEHLAFVLETERDGLLCGSPWHQEGGPLATWNGGTAYSGPLLVEVFDMLTNDMCRSCIEGNGVPDI